MRARACVLACARGTVGHARPALTFTETKKLINRLIYSVVIRGHAIPRCIFPPPNVIHSVARRGGGRAHALDEWIDVEKAQSVKGMSTGLLMLLAMADMP